MVKRALIWGGAIAAVIVATAGLMIFATAGATVFRVEGDRLYMSGPMTGASPERFEMLVEQHPGLTTVVFGDMADVADITALIQNGYRIRGLGLVTEVTAGARIEGDAVWLILGGVERQIGDRAEIVLRDWGGAALDREAAAHEERRRYVADMLGDDAFYWRSLDGAASGHVMTGLEIEDFGLATDG